ncbi:MAG: carbon-nitrogen hydrolase family protein [Candidatus Omnitrophica bacterium]|nr:carbon-nitrogen hydrolase family protein [Candidatus Omnitrophota bacterium]
MLKSIRVGMGQMLVEGGALEANLERAIAFIEEARERVCDLLILPECLDLGWTFADSRNLAQPIPGQVSEILCEGARRSGIEVVAGVTEREGDRVYNASIWISKQGEILGRHRKINLLDIARDLYTPGSSLSVFESSIGPVGMAICADNFPESLDLARSLARMGARLIASPCAWAVDSDHDQRVDPYGDLWRGSYGALTREWEVSMIGVSNVGWISSGPWKGRKCIGCSLAMGPGGKVLTEGPYGEEAQELIVLDLELP